MKKLRPILEVDKFKELLVYCFFSLLVTLISNSYAFNPFLLGLIFLSYNRGINTYIFTLSVNLMTSFIISIPYGIEMVILNVLFFLNCLFFCLIKHRYHLKKYGPFVLTYLILIVLYLFKSFSITLLLNLLLTFIVACILLYGYENLNNCILENNVEFDNRAKVIVLSTFSLLFFGIYGFYLICARIIHIIICKISSPIIGALSLIINCLILFYLQNISYNLLITLLFPAVLSVFINKKYVSLTYLVSFVFVNAFLIDEFYTSIFFYQGVASVVISFLIPKKVYNYFSDLFSREENKLYLETFNNLNAISEEINNIIAYLDIVLDSSIKNQYNPEDRIIELMKKKICIECSKKGTCDLFKMIKMSLNAGFDSQSKGILFEKCPYPYKILRYIRVSASSLKNEQVLINEIKNSNLLYQKEIENIYRPLRNVFDKANFVVRKKSILWQTLDSHGVKINNLVLNDDSMSFEIALDKKEEIEKVIDIINSTLKKNYYVIDMFFVLSLGVYQVKLASSSLYYIDEAVMSRGLHNNENGDAFLTLMENNHYYLLLSDGIGHDNDASNISFFLIKSLSCYRKIDNDVISQLNNINTLLKSKVDEERYATLDYIDINLVNGKMNLFKCGSFNSYLFRDNVLIKFKSNTPPIGILDNINTSSLEKDLMNNDVLIFMSDGYDDNPDQIIENVLKHYSSEDAEQIKIRLNDQLLKKQSVKDDRTLIVLKIKFAKKALEAKNIGISLKKI